MVSRHSDDRRKGLWAADVMADVVAMCRGVDCVVCVWPADAGVGGGRHGTAQGLGFNCSVLSFVI